MTQIYIIKPDTLVSTIDAFKSGSSRWGEDVRQKLQDAKLDTTAETQALQAAILKITIGTLMPLVTVKLANAETRDKLVPLLPNTKIEPDVPFRVAI